MQRPQTAIIGVAESDLGRTPAKTVLQLQQQASRAALADAGLNFGDVDAAHERIVVGVAVKVTFAAMGEDLTLPYFRLVE
jgi:acetyl-CoA acetyltransferase